jgi:hypothetical protein
LSSDSVTESPPGTLTLSTPSSAQADKRRELFAKVGTRAAVLSKVIARGESNVDHFIEEQLGLAEEDVLGLTSYGSPHVDRVEGKPLHL